MKITRRKLLRGAGSLAGAVLLGSSVLGAARRKRSRRKAPAKARASETGPLSGAKLYADVISYYNLGEHRTASDVDLRTSQWMLEQLRGAGLKATLQPFSLRQFSVKQTRLSIGGNAIRAFPLWFPRSTGQQPIIGNLVPIGKADPPGSLRGKIALARFPASAGGAMQEGSIHSQIVRAAFQAGASGVVAVTESATQEIIALNTPAGAGPWPIPVVLVGQRDEPLLNSAARSGLNVSLLLDGDDEPQAQAKNVIARVDQGKDLVVVSTPQSGWFRCAGERGPGIALFLGLARWAKGRASGSS